MNKKLKKIASLATRSILYEVVISPKPGLVDRFDNGSHSDMNIYHFINSAFSLQNHFENYLKIGYEHSSQDINNLFDKLRKEGVLAEKSMFEATDNVNTHKGLNFAFAIILGAIGYYLKLNHKSKYIDFDVVFQIVKNMSKNLIEKDFSDINESNAKSYGEKLYVKYGILGPRGEAAGGYAFILDKILPYIQKRKNEEYDHEKIFLEVLILLMTKVEDGNLIHRGGIGEWRKVKLEAEKLYEKILKGEDIRILLNKYNKVLIERNLSPGGAADLLCISIFLNDLSLLSLYKNKSINFR